MNYPDVLVIRGEYQYRYDPPFVPGHECAGTLLEVGSDVDGFAVGDRVLAMSGTGAFAEEVVCDSAGRRNQVFRIPDAHAVRRGGRLRPHVRHRDPRLAPRGAAGR